MGGFSATPKDDREGLSPIFTVYNLANLLWSRRVHHVSRLLELELLQSRVGRDDERRRESGDSYHKGCASDYYKRPPERVAPSYLEPGLISNITKRAT